MLRDEEDDDTRNTQHGSSEDDNKCYSPHSRIDMKMAERVEIEDRRGKNDHMVEGLWHMKVSWGGMVVVA
ncbi:hypothetical protein VNO80_19329 [Phaseolus coccineus]|uniref:Uncharacterized protein n=1 Tax=Phaseolus coccineus TaxID=3886 RepID=A0AAN9MH37_PHACN